MRPLLLALLVAVAGCAPSAELRIPRPSAPLAPGRLVVVPVGPRSAPSAVGAEEGVAAAAAFASDAEHEAAFWAAFVEGLRAELAPLAVELGPATTREAFSLRRALVQHEGRQAGRGRWAAEAVSLPDTAAVAAYGADYVLFVDGARARVDRSGTPIGAGIGRVFVVAHVPTRGIQAGARMVLWRAGQPAPLLAHEVWAGEEGSGLLDNRLDRAVWDRTLAELAAETARAAGGRPRA